MIFTFEGIANKDRPVPEPEYTASVEDVYTATAITLLYHGTSLDLLALADIAVRKQTIGFADLGSRSSSPFLFVAVPSVR